MRGSICWLAGAQALDAVAADYEWLPGRLRCDYSGQVRGHRQKVAGHSDRARLGGAAVLDRGHLFLAELLDFGPSVIHEAGLALPPAVAVEPKGLTVEGSKQARRHSDALVTETCDEVSERLGDRGCRLNRKH